MSVGKSTVDKWVRQLKDELNGHSDTRTTSRYAHLMDDMAASAANKTASFLEGLLTT
jgi:hypothetical protein